MIEATAATALEQREYLIRRKILTLFGAKFHVYDAAGNLIAFSKQKAFKLREDIRVYRSEDMRDELLTIQARTVIDFAAAYDVVDAQAQTKIGALRRKGFSSMVRDSWEFLDENDQPIAQLQEDSVALALIRRFLVNLIPQSFHAMKGEKSVIHYKQHFNPFVLRLGVTIEDESAGIDPRLALAAGILLAAIEGRQN